MVTIKINKPKISSIQNVTKPLISSVVTSKTYSDTLSSWTLETFTSTGVISDSRAVKAKCSWSPSNVYSGTDIYPSSLDTLESRKVSRETLATTDAFGSVRRKIDPLIPMNYVLRPNKQEYNPVLEWELIKRKCSQLFKL
ncbi:uncharacterized protein LOC131843196 isoform X2 [Achroia grisella]|uniref:uncharacterized protein LOC131843196 isoform X2 n=1 Tax=Achroia grisella TaxID=688607 RepID=UPI0027D2C45C|nr:uncharacterized protein LOC131843196 isoform X2 [Achroia grisella]